MNKTLLSILKAIGLTALLIIVLIVTLFLFGGRAMSYVMMFLGCLFIVKILHPVFSETGKKKARK